jgi:hypothetical protein
LDSLGFIHLVCHPFPVLLYQNTGLSVSLLVFLPATKVLLESQHSFLDPYYQQEKNSGKVCENDSKFVREEIHFQHKAWHL